MVTRVETISNLVRNILENPELYRIPKIQRGFVWDWNKVKDFFESLYKGYPVGIIILWKTKEYIPSDPVINPEYACRISGIDISQSPEETKNYYYILDGNQRLTSLLLALSRWKIERGKWKIDLYQEDPSHSDIYYNPKNDNFTFSKKDSISIVSILRNRFFADPIAQGEINQFDSKLQQKIIKTADQILGHDIPIYEIEKSIRDYNELCEIFNRINFSGVKIKNLDIVLSFFASEFSTFRDRIIEICEKYDIDLRAGIRFIFSRFGIRQGQLKREGALNITQYIRKEFSNQAIDNILARCEQAIKAVLDFLEWLGVKNTKLIPSQISLIPIWVWVCYKIEEGNRDPLSLLKANEEYILKWWIPVILRQHYTTPDSKLQKDLNTIYKKRKDSNFPTDDLLKNTLRRRKAEKQLTIGEIEVLEDFSARRKIFKLIIAILLNKKRATDFYKDILISDLIKNDEVTVHHIFSRNALAKADVSYEEADVQHFANITFLHPETNNQIKDQPPEDYLSTIDNKVLKAHLIPIDNNLWRCQRFEEFLEERKKLIIEELRNLKILK